MLHERVSSAEPIHPAWCSCGGCSTGPRPDLRRDVGFIGLGIVCALLVVAAIASSPIIGRYVGAWWH